MKSKKLMSRIKNRYGKRILTLVNQPLFWLMTVIGNAMILIGSILLFQFEAKEGLKFIDCILWSTSIVTTVGYVNYMPETFLGKMTILALMLLGTVFLWSYMAFLVSALISPALNSLEKEVQDVEKEISDLKIEEQKIKT